MQWQSLNDFLVMGGYGLYVWGSFGVCVIAMIAEPLMVRQRRKQAIKQLRAEADS